MKFGALLRTTRAQRPQKLVRSRRGVSHGMQNGFCASAQLFCMRTARSTSKSRSFPVEKRANFALKKLKISALPAADARAKQEKLTKNSSMHAAHDAQLLQSSAALLRQ